MAAASPKNSRSGPALAAFLGNRRESIAAMDFFTVPTLRVWRSVLLPYCSFVIGHDRRRILHFNVTRNPNALWVVQQLRRFRISSPCTLTHNSGMRRLLRSEDRVKHARSYMKSIFAEAVEQDFLLKDPTRGIKIPRNLREKDKTTLTWHQLRAVLAGVTTRDRMLLTLEMTDALRPSELFALRWRSFDGSKLTIRETVYRGKIRPFGKTEKSLGDVRLPKGMVDDLWLWKQECPDSSADAFMFPNTDGGFMDTGNYRNRILILLAEKLGLPKLNFQVLRRTMATLAQGKGSVKDIQAHLRHSKADTTANEYMQELPESVGRMVESMYDELMHSQAAASADLLPNATNEDGGPTAMCMRNMVGTTGLEPATSTVSI
jgi:integrase